MLDVTPTPLQRLLRERRRGYSLPAMALLCCSRPTSDLVIER